MKYKAKPFEPEEPNELVEQVAGNGGAVVRVVGGGLVDVLKPARESIHIEDIAHALSMLCRYGGHTPEHYSVAQHSCLVAQLLEPRLRIYGLLHDAAEAYLGDVVSPLKGQLALKGKPFCEAEEELRAAILRALDVPDLEADGWWQVWAADVSARMLEEATFGCGETADEPFPHIVQLEAWTAGTARGQWLKAVDYERKRRG